MIEIVQTLSAQFLYQSIHYTFLFCCVTVCKKGGVYHGRYFETTLLSTSTTNFSLTARAAATAYRYESIGAKAVPNGNGYASADPHPKL